MRGGGRGGAGGKYYFILFLDSPERDALLLPAGPQPVSSLLYGQEVLSRFHCMLTTQMDKTSWAFCIIFMCYDYFFSSQYLMFYITQMSN